MKKKIRYLTITSCGGRLNFLGNKASPDAIIGSRD